MYLPTTPERNAPIVTSPATGGDGSGAVGTAVPACSGGAVPSADRLVAAGFPQNENNVFLAETVGAIANSSTLAPGCWDTSRDGERFELIGFDY